MEEEKEKMTIRKSELRKYKSCDTCGEFFHPKQPFGVRCKECARVLQAIRSGLYRMYSKSILAERYPEYKFKVVLRKNDYDKDRIKK